MNIDAHLVQYASIVNDSPHYAIAVEAPTGSAIISYANPRLWDPNDFGSKLNLTGFVPLGTGWPMGVFEGWFAAQPY